MHLLAERQILAALSEGGWVQGDVEDMMEHRLCALFMPHGEAGHVSVFKHRRVMPAYAMWWGRPAALSLHVPLSRLLHVQTSLVCLPGWAGC